jgi:hypothetical protein
MLVLVFVLISLSLVSAQPNYQERVVYYSADDNACSTYHSTDYIDITINFNGTYLRTFRNADGNTDCDQD